MEPELVPCGEIFQLQVRHLPIGDADQCPAASTDSRGTQANVFYGAECVAYLQHVSRLHHAVEDDRDSTQDIFQRLLSGECDGNSTHPEPGQRGGGVQAEVVQAEKQAEEDNQHIEYSAAQTKHGSSAHIAAAHQAKPDVVLHPFIEKDK